MKCRRLRARRERDPAELNITAFMNLMVVLVPFLLITAVFSRLAVLELNLPAAAEAAEEPPAFALELVVREQGITVLDRASGPLTHLPRGDDGHDLDQLSAYLVRIKLRHPEVSEATLLLEPEVDYDTLVQDMDTVRAVAQFQNDRSVQAELFPHIAIGDAPPPGG